MNTLLREVSDERRAAIDLLERVDLEIEKMTEHRELDRALATLWEDVRAFLRKVP